MRRRGLGTTVANRKVHRKFELTSLFDDLAREGRTPSTTVLSFTREPNPRAAAGLDLPGETEFVSLVRLRRADGVPLALMRNWLPPIADLSTEELEVTGLYAILRTRGIRPAVARQNIGARMPTKAERQHLEITGTKPVLTMTRMAFDDRGRAVEFGDHCYRASDYSIDLMVTER